MPHPELSKTKLSQDLFTAIDVTQTFDRHGGPIRNPRRKTRTGWFVPRRQGCFATQLTHFALVQTDFDQRTAHCMLRCGTTPGTIVVEIINSGSVNDILNATTARD